MEKAAAKFWRKVTALLKPHALAMRVIGRKSPREWWGLREQRRGVSM